MQVALERRPGSIAALTVTIEPVEIAARVEQLFQKYARRVNIPGFRPGKAPRRLLEERISPDSLRMEAVESLIDVHYKAALAQLELEPLERGEIEDLNMNDDGSVTFVAIVTIRPQVTLPDYSAITITHEATTVSDEQVAAQIEQYREHTAEYADVEDGIQTGDYVTVDYTMTVDGQPYPEGDASGYPLEVGTDTFFPQLNDGLIGVKAGETATLAVDYPTDYSNADLAGKHADFTVTVLQVRRRTVPEATDAWAQMVTGGQAQNMDELREIVSQNMTRSADESDREAVRADLIRQLVEGSELELPEFMVDEEYEHLMEQLRHQLSHDHMSMEDYANMMGATVASIEQERRVLARDYVRRSLVLQEVARREDISIADEELDMLVRMVAMSSGQAPNEMSRSALRRMRKELEESGHLNHLASRLFHEKVLSLLESKATITVAGQEAPPTDADAAAPAEEAPAEAKPKRKKKAADAAPAEDTAEPEAKPKKKRAAKKAAEEAPASPDAESAG
ncbi:MAG: Trigger factor [bacterium ADurb.Bin429]|nr:MAG: Trigger factor [bacterium ADurb.Bin429]